MLCSVGLQPPLLRIRKIFILKVFVVKASDKRDLNLAPLDFQKLSQFLQALRLKICCDAPLQHLATLTFLSITSLYYVVLRRFSIFPALPTLQAKDQRKSPSASKVFAKKLANLTKIILKTLRSVGLRPPLLSFRHLV